MSMVTVHGPYTMYSKAVVGNSNGSARATVNPANGLIWTLIPTDQSQVAANYDWTWTPTNAGDAPTSPQNDVKSPTVVFGVAGAKVITLTLNGVAQPPINLTAVSGVAPMMLMGAPPDGGDGGDGGEEPPPEVQVGYDPGAHTVPEVEDFANEHPEQLEEIIAAEEAGKARVTLLSYLEGLRA